MLLEAKPKVLWMVSDPVELAIRTTRGGYDGINAPQSGICPAFSICVVIPRLLWDQMANVKLSQGPWPARVDILASTYVFHSSSHGCYGIKLFFGTTFQHNLMSVIQPQEEWVT